jgi:hypothetical protein
MLERGFEATVGSMLYFQSGWGLLCAQIPRKISIPRIS